jgi:hypothetical protein
LGLAFDHTLRMRASRNAELTQRAARGTAFANFCLWEVQDMDLPGRGLGRSQSER